MTDPTPNPSRHHVVVVGKLRHPRGGKTTQSSDVDGGSSLEEPTPLSWGHHLESPQGSGPVEPSGVGTHRLEMTSKWRSEWLARRFILEAHESICQQVKAFHYRAKVGVHQG